MRLDDVGEFVAWLRLPLQARHGRVAVVPSVQHHCTESTVNRKLSAIGVFYAHAARGGVAVGELLTSWQVGGARSGWRPFLHHISKSEPKPRRVIALKAPKKLPRVLTPEEVQAVLDNCDRLRQIRRARNRRAASSVGSALGMDSSQPTGDRHSRTHTTVEQETADRVDAAGSVPRPRRS